MTPDELLNDLRPLEERLRSSDVTEFIKLQDAGARQQFVADRETLSVAIGRLENAQLAEIAERLAGLDGALKSGILDLHQSLESVEKTVAIIGAVGTVAGLAARVAGLVR
jgi:hypothetical protein